MIHDLTEKLIVQTPEGVKFPLNPASPITRFLAWVIDWMGISAVMLVAGKVITIFGYFSPDLYIAVYTLAYFVVTFAYYIVLERFWSGQTIGKRLLKLRVTDVQGLHLSLGQIILRNLLRAIDGLPLFYMVGGVTSVLTRHGQRLGDLAANTVVIRTRDLTRPELAQVLTGKFNSFREHPLLCRRLQQSVPPLLAEVVLQAVLRRNELDPDARIKVFHQLAEHFRKVVAFPEEAVVGLSDEQYVRNLLEILFRDDKRSDPRPSE